MTGLSPTASEGRETPDQALARAQVAAQAKHFGEAGGICDDILTAHPDYPAALALLGVIQAQTGRTEQAIELLERAVKRQPGVAAWQANLCSLYRHCNQIERALAAGHEAMRLEPNNPDTLVNLSLVFTDIDDVERAVACLLRAIGMNSQHADAHLALAQNLLARGEYGPGWLEYEWRNQTAAARGQLPKMTSAAWNGMELPAGKILLIGDQGYGDTIQFARFIPRVAERCEEVLLGCSAEILPLLARIPGVSRCFSRWDVIPGHAAHCRLSSLALMLGGSPDGQDGPYLVADPGRISKWQAWLREFHPQPLPRIGLAWSGRPTHPNDRRRSLRLARLAPLAGAGAARFISLQKPMPTVDIAVLPQFPGLVDIAPDLADFEDTAALISCLDLVITVDTAIGHLAGALAKPVWIMLAKAADWRWMLNRCDSPWYRSARLFRQRASGAWDALIAEIAEALGAYLQAGRSTAAD
jgi:Tfp pilus assembly protein PilF